MKNRNMRQTLIVCTILLLTSPLLWSSESASPQARVKEILRLFQSFDRYPILEEDNHGRTYGRSYAKSYDQTVSLTNTGISTEIINISGSYESFMIQHEEFTFTLDDLLYCSEKTSNRPGEAALYLGVKPGKQYGQLTYSRGGQKYREDPKADHMGDQVHRLNGTTLSTPDKQLVAQILKLLEAEYGCRSAHNKSLRVAQEKREWNEAVKKDTLAAYEAFHKNWPSGQFATAVDDKAWQIAKRLNSIAAYENYASKWPKGIHAKDVPSMKQALIKAATRQRDDSAWEKAVAARTPKALAEYERSWPGGRHTGEIKQRLLVIDDAAWERYRKWPSLLLNDYALKFPQGVHLDEADDLHWADSKSYRSDRDTHFGEWPNCRHTRERNAWLEAKAWPFVNTSKGSHEQDLAAIEKHLQQFPEGDHVGKVRARIQRLKDEIADRDRWLAALEANTESSYSNYLENSLDQSEFIDKAHAELAWIETRKSDSTEAYQNFRKSHPGTRHWTKADRWLQDKRWERVTEVNSFSAYEDYLLRQPADHHVEEARVRVQDTSWEAAKAENSVAGYEKYLRLYPTGHHSSAAKQALSNASIPEDAIKVRRGRKFSDCKGCPRMIEIAAGSFLMGTPWSEWHWSISYEGGKASVKKDDKDPSSLQEYFSKRIPRHSVSFSRPFAIGIHEVTVDEFSLFVKETGFESETNCTDTLKIAENDNLPRDQRDYKDLYTASWRNPGFKQSGSHPVVCIGVQDAKQYATWLSQKTGNRYRLPTEAEWEYAARAGTLTPFFSGDTITQKQANCCDIPATGTKRVSAYKANGFGLRNTYGNACEFTEDCISQTYTGSVAGVTIDSDAGECAKRWTVRGGGFYWGELLATSRIPLDIGSLSYHSSQQGFRIVRDL